MLGIERHGTGRRRLALLQAITSTGSIAKAARSVGLSYKGAWDAVEAMNNLAGGQLVRRTTGGRGGGGTRLTARGLELLRLQEQLSEQQRGFIARIERERHGAARDLPVLGQLAMLTSARNQFAGRVKRVIPGAVNDEIELEIGGGGSLVATITRESTRLLRLQPGAPVTALIKASWVILAPASRKPLACTAGNQLKGTVRRITRGAVNSEVILSLRGDQTLVAIVTNESVRAIGLKKARPVAAIFNASSVILVRLD